MTASATPAAPTAVHDTDLAEQARPGHGVPSQDPNPAAQTALEPEEAEREAKSALAGGGVLGGAAVGATLGVVVGGPVGVLVGGALGAVAGALGAVAAGTVMNPDDSSSAAPVLEDSAPAQAGHDATIGAAKPPAAR